MWIYSPTFLGYCPLTLKWGVRVKPKPGFSYLDTLVSQEAEPNIPACEAPILKALPKRQRSPSKEDNTQLEGNAQTQTLTPQTND